MIDEKKFTERLIQLVGDKGNAAFERKTGVGEANIRKYIRGGSLPTLRILDKIATANSVTISWLAGEDVHILSDSTHLSAIGKCVQEFLQGKSLYYLSEKTGIPESTLRRNFKNGANPKADLLEKVATFFGTTPDDLTRIATNNDVEIRFGRIAAGFKYVDSDLARERKTRVINEMLLVDLKPGDEVFVWLRQGKLITTSAINDADTGMLILHWTWKTTKNAYYDLETLGLEFWLNENIHRLLTTNGRSWLNPLIPEIEESSQSSDTSNAHVENPSMHEINLWISEQDDGINYWEVAKSKLALEFPEFKEWLKKHRGMHNQLADEKLTSNGG